MSSIYFSLRQHSRKLHCAVNCHRTFHTITRFLPEIDTESARSFLREQMYKDAQNFFSVIDQNIRDQNLAIDVQASFRMGHKLRTYVSIAAENNVELVVIQGKDEDQIAMHGLSYPLAVELNHLPLLIV